MKTTVAFLLSFSLLLPLAGAQKRPPTKRAPTGPEKLISLKVTGTTRYSDKEILGASGLRIGQDAAEGDFKEAAQILGSSGMFRDVVYSYLSSGSGIRLEFQLSDVDEKKSVPAHFDNFVWFTDEELSAQLRQRVPLFKQQLPVGGNLPDRVSDALQAMFLEKHIPGRVDYLREGDQAGGDLHGIDYHVEEVGIKINGIDFPGASAEQAALLTSAAHRTIGADYSRNGLAAVAKFDLLPVYLQRGYLKAEFGTPNARVLPATTAADAHDPGDVEVEAIVPVTTGKVYVASAITWKGNSALATTELAPLLHLAKGQPVNAVQLESDLEKVNKLYRSRGYMVAKISSQNQFDEAKGSVAYELEVTEGDQYKMGDLEINGLDTQAKARMQAAWTLREGEPYNADYPKKFFEETRQLLPRGVSWGVNIHETLDAKDKTVDVEVRFKPQ